MPGGPIFNCYPGPFQMLDAVASAPVGREDIADVKTVYDRINNPYHVIFGHEFIQRWWKKQILFSIVGFYR